MEAVKKLAILLIQWESARTRMWLNGSRQQDIEKSLSVHVMVASISIGNPPNPTPVQEKKINTNKGAEVSTVGLLPTSSSLPSVWPESQATSSGNAVQMDDSDKFVWEKAIHHPNRSIFDIRLSHSLELWQLQYYFPTPCCRVGNGCVRGLRGNDDLLRVNLLRGMGILHWLQNHSVMPSCWMMSRRERKIYSCIDMGVWFVGLDVDS